MQTKALWPYVPSIRPAGTAIAQEQPVTHVDSTCLWIQSCLGQPVSRPCQATKSDNDGAMGRLSEELDVERIVRTAHEKDLLVTGIRPNSDFDLSKHTPVSRWPVELPAARHHSPLLCALDPLGKNKRRRRQSATMGH